MHILSRDYVAVAIGMVMVAVLSRRMGLIGDSEISEIVDMLKFADLPTSLRTPISADDFIDAMLRDKKSVSGQLRFVVIDSIGKTHTENVDKKIVKKAIADFQKM